MRGITGTVGWVIGVQGAPGVAGSVFGDHPWGLLQQWWVVPAGGYVALAVAGAVLALWGGAARRKRA
ncbi:hypothetical protein [Streptomyces sp. Wb2n-11]|uniref:hypothetical protein n=1 Tax=Streptomyces sp. Wb2n-11 TaxID=1030533 RepID=UPI000A6BCB2F|nr:hypothetical protein [Streptomyces sp. Wb2n-11]